MTEGHVLRWYLARRVTDTDPEPWHDDLHPLLMAYRRTVSVMKFRIAFLPGQPCILGVFSPDVPTDDFILAIERVLEQRGLTDEFVLPMPVEVSLCNYLARRQAQVRSNLQPGEFVANSRNLHEVPLDIDGKIITTERSN